MTVTAAQTKELRDKTGVGMLTCMKALEEANGDMDKAVDILRKKGEAKAEAKASRETAEGRVAISGRAIVKLLCETDFVAKNEKFQALVEELAKKAETDGVDGAKSHFESVQKDYVQEIGENMKLDQAEVVEGGSVVGSYVHSNGKLGAIVILDGGTEMQAKDVAMHAVAMNPLVANPEDVPQENINKEKEIYVDQLKAEGKPAEIIDKIVEGKVKKYCVERALSSQPFVKDPSQTISQYLGDAKLVKFVRYEV
ncbi:translation elongation factor Ts [Candidatus Gracilibacteria bacterium]|nr:translation elongation factor Ts [Candidatus Gracilibacteria bacterium]